MAANVVNDEVLGAYLDGELDEAGRAEIELVVAENAGVALRLKRLQQADAVLRQAMAAAPSQRDAALARRLLEVAPAAPRWDRLMPTARVLAPLAAAMVLGLLVGRLATPAAVDGSGLASLRIEPALARVLDQTQSGETASVLGGEAEMALSLKAEDGVTCRQFRLTSAHGASDALACRQDGEWRLRAQVVLGPDGLGGYRTAGAAEAQSALDVVVEAMGAVVVMDADEESEAIANGWR